MEYVAPSDSGKYLHHHMQRMGSYFVGHTTGRTACSVVTTATRLRFNVCATCVRRMEVAGQSPDGRMAVASLL